MTQAETEQALYALQGKVTALEWAVKVLIATHPTKQLASMTWDGAKGIELEAYIGHATGANHMRRGAVLAEFSELTRLFERVATEEVAASHDA